MRIFLLLNDFIVGIEKPDEICPPAFFVQIFGIYFTLIYLFY